MLVAAPMDREEQNGPRRDGSDRPWGLFSRGLCEMHASSNPAGDPCTEAVWVHAPCPPLGDELGQGRRAVQCKDHTLLGLAQSEHLVQALIQQQVEMVDVVGCIAWQYRFMMM